MEGGDWGRAQQSGFNRLPGEAGVPGGQGSAAGTKAGNTEKQGGFRANCNGDSDVQCDPDERVLCKLRGEQKSALPWKMR